MLEDDERPKRWAEHPRWQELHEVLGELVDNAEVAEAIVASHVIDAERMKRLCAALHLMPKLIGKALLNASELPGYAPPEPVRPSGALDAVERVEVVVDGTPTCVGENNAGEPVLVSVTRYDPASDTTYEVLEEPAEPAYDIHREVAAKMFGVPESEVTPEQREAAKTSNFGQVLRTEEIRYAVMESHYDPAEDDE